MSYQKKIWSLLLTEKLGFLLITIAVQCLQMMANMNTNINELFDVSVIQVQ